MLDHCPARIILFTSLTPHTPLKRLKLDLLADLRREQKRYHFFFSGHRGAGKSTQLNQLAIDKELKEQFFIVHYRIGDVGDPIT